MPLPDFNGEGDLPAGVHVASLAEVRFRFGGASAKRARATRSLQRIYDLAAATTYLDAVVVFGSYVSDVAEPNDVDVLLVMKDDFRPENCSEDAAPLFDHLQAQDAFGASVFWVRPAMLLGQPLEAFIRNWGGKRGGGERGVVEVRHDSK